MASQSPVWETIQERSQLMRSRCSVRLFPLPLRYHDSNAAQGSVGYFTRPISELLRLCISRLQSLQSAPIHLLALCRLLWQGGQPVRSSQSSPRPWTRCTCAFKPTMCCQVAVPTFGVIHGVGRAKLALEASLQAGRYPGSKMGSAALRSLPPSKDSNPKAFTRS